MSDTPLHDLLEATLAPAGWEPLPDGDGWRCDVDLGGDGGAPLPAALAVVPLGPGLDAPAVFTATTPLPVRPDHAAQARSLLRAWAGDHAPVGALEVAGGHPRYRLVHDPAVAPWSRDIVGGLVGAGTAWAGRLLPRALRVLLLGRVSFAGEFVDSGSGSRDAQ